MYEEWFFSISVHHLIERAGLQPGTEQFRYWERSHAVGREKQRPGLRLTGQATATGGRQCFGNYVADTAQYARHSAPGQFQ